MLAKIVDQVNKKISGDVSEPEFEIKNINKGVQTEISGIQTKIKDVKPTIERTKFETPIRNTEMGFHELETRINQTANSIKQIR